MKQILSFLLFLILLTACNDSQIIDTVQRDFIVEENDNRPVFNRTELPEPEDNREIVNSSENPQNNQSVFITASEQSTSFKVPIGWSLGKNYPLITLNELPLLRPAAIQTGDNRFRGYRQHIIFSNKTGNVTFVVDEDRDPEYIGTVLKYDEDERFFAYELLMDGRPFFDPVLLGSDVLLLGREYRIMEATDITLLLNGVDIEQFFRIEDKKRFQTNDKIISSEVDYNGLAFRYWLSAPDINDDSMNLRPQETLRERLAEDFQEDAFLGVFDLRYEGIDSFVGNTIVFDADDDDIVLSVNDLTIPLLVKDEQGLLRYGNDRKVHFQECEDRRDACIRDDDSFVIQAMVDGKLVTRMLRVAGIDEEERKIIFRDVETTERVSVDWVGRDMRAILPFLDREYLVHAINSTQELENGSFVNVTDGLAIDLDGDRRISGEIVPLLFENLEITIDELPENISQGTINITLESGYKNTNQRRDYLGALNKEELIVQVGYDNGFFVRLPLRDSLWNQKLQVDSEDEYAHGLSLWGTRVWLDYTGDEQETTDDLLLEIPYEQRYATVTMGKLE